MYEFKKCSLCGREQRLHLIKVYYKNGKPTTKRYQDDIGQFTLNNLCTFCMAKKRAAIYERARMRTKEKRKKEHEQKIEELKKIKERKCTKCGAIKGVKFSDVYYYPRGPVYVFIENDTGQKWYNHRCSDCRRDDCRRSKGHTSRDDSKKPIVIMAVKSEKLAEAHFKMMGFEVKRALHKGPDLTIKKDGKKMLVEVKTATKSKATITWRVGAVRPHRINDDLIAIVLPNGYVHVETMKRHLRKCGKHGSRTVTRIVRQYGLTPINPQNTIRP